MASDIPPAADSDSETYFTQRPTKTRFLVLGVLCLLSGILYLDRICIASALSEIERDLQLTHKQTSYFLMAFTLAYGLFEVPTGRWGDRIGVRRVLTRIALWWSAFTALTGACTGLGMLIVVRFLFGAGEAGAFPNSARVLSRWFPDRERGRVQGVFVAASQVGGAIAPLLATSLILWIGWRWTFVAFGFVGVFWAAGFYWWFRDDPAEHPGVNDAEVAIIGQHATSGLVHTEIPWRAVSVNPSVWFLAGIMTLASFNSYIYFSWYQKYLEAARFLPKEQAGAMSSMVLAFSAVGTLLGGVLVDRFVRGHSLASRRIMGCCAFFMAAGLLYSALQTEHAWTAAVLTSLSCFMTQGTQPLWWNCATGISGKHIGALFGLMNSVGVAGAMSSQFLVGAIADWLGEYGYSGRAQWDPIFYIDVGVLMLAGLLWANFLFKPVEPDINTEIAELEADGHH